MRWMMIFASIFLGIDKRVIPRQLLQFLRFPFLGILSILLTIASSRLPSLPFIRVSPDDSRGPSRPVMFVAVSVTKTFWRNWVVGPVPNLQPGGPVDHFSSDLYPLTCPAWVALPGDESPAGIALRVNETHKPPDHDKVVILQGDRPRAKGVKVLYSTIVQNFCLFIYRSSRNTQSSNQGFSFRVSSGLIPGLRKF